MAPMICSRVDLPLPLGPMIARESPALTVKETPRKARKRPLGNVRSTSVN
jgi:hypothetical protein